MSSAVIGKTKSAGFQAGKRKTLELSSDCLWRIVVSSKGQEPLGQNPKQIDPYTNGLSTFVEGSHYRQTVETELGKSALLQVRIISVGSKKSTLALHIEKLVDSTQREKFLNLFNSALRSFESEAEKTTVRH